MLSREAGAYAELAPWCVGVDPLDVGEQAAALRHAIGLPVEARRAWREAIAMHVRTHDLEAWSERELAELEARAPLPRS